MFKEFKTNDIITLKTPININNNYTNVKGTITEITENNIIIQISTEDNFEEIKLEFDKNKIKPNDFEIVDLLKEEFTFPEKENETFNQDNIQYFKKIYLQKEDWNTEFNIDEQKTDMYNRELNKLPYHKSKFFEKRIK